MPQLDSFILFDSVVLATLVFGLIHGAMVEYVLPIWVRKRVLGSVIIYKVISVETRIRGRWIF